MTINYQQLAQELYEVLNEVNVFIDFEKLPLSLAEKMDQVDKKYKEKTTKGTGRTKMKAIAEALANPDKKVEFVDYLPHRVSTVKSHVDGLEILIKKLGYDIDVWCEGT